MKMMSFSNGPVRIAFGAAIVVLLALGVISYRGIALSGEGDRLVRHTDEVIENLQSAVFGMEAISSSIRGFALTGSESYLETYRVAKLDVERHMEAVRKLTADNPEQRLKLATLEKLAVTRFRRAEIIIDLRRSQGLQATADEINLGPGQQISDEVQTIASQLRDEEQRLMKQRRSDAAQRLNWTKFLLILGTMLGLLITVTAGWSVLRDSSRRGRAERALRESEAQYRMLLDGIQESAIFMMDPKGQIINWNVGAERIKGYRSDEIIGRNFSCFFLPEDIARGRPQDVLRLAAAGDHYQEQSTRIRKDGSQFLASVTLTALRDAAGELRGFSEFSYDLSKIKESEAKYRGLLEAAPDAMVVVNQQGEIVLLNVQAEKQFGYHRDELLGQQVTNIIPEGFAERLIADDLRSAEDALAQQIGTGIELTGRRKDGSGFPIEIMLSPLASSKGTLVTAAIRNISVRKAADARLAQMEGRYRGLLEAAPDAMVVVNQQGEIVLLNVQAERQFGYRRDELLAQQVTTIIPEGFAERLIADDLRSDDDALAQQIGTGIELIGRRKDGSGFPIELMLSPLVSAEGTLVTAAIRNISVRKRADEHLVRKIEELNRSNEELGQFAYIASHDLQEPLRMVASYTQLLSRRYKGKLDADADEYIAFAVDGASRMQRLIQDLLAYSRVSTNGSELRNTSSEDALQQALTNLRGAIHDGHALITHDPLPAVLADGTQLTQLFQNLVGNAIKYQPAGIPQIHISAIEDVENKWVFSVKDNGLGIDPQYFDRIFGMFQRLHKRDEFAGTGIGLAICKKIVEQHGGTISVESQPGKGSTFRFGLSAQ